MIGNHNKLFNLHLIYHDNNDDTMRVMFSSLRREDGIIVFRDEDGNLQPEYESRVNLNDLIERRRGWMSWKLDNVELSITKNSEYTRYEMFRKDMTLEHATKWIEMCYELE